MKLSIPQIQHNGVLPKQFTCDGDNVSPALEIHDIPDGTKSMALIVNDPDSPKGDFIHWISYDIPPVNRIGQGDHPGKEGINDFGRLRYDGPCPVSGEHHYHFIAYALNEEKLGLGQGATIQEVDGKILGHIIDRAEAVARYGRKSL